MVSSFSDQQWANCSLLLVAMSLSFVFVFFFLYSIFSQFLFWRAFTAMCLMRALFWPCLVRICLSGPSWWLTTVSLSSMHISAPHWFVKSICFTSHCCYSHSNSAYTIEACHSFKTTPVVQSGRYWCQRWQRYCNKLIKIDAFGLGAYEFWRCSLLDIFMISYAGCKIESWILKVRMHPDTDPG